MSDNAFAYSTEHDVTNIFLHNMTRLLFWHKLAKTIQNDSIWGSAWVKGGSTHLSSHFPWKVLYGSNPKRLTDSMDNFELKERWWRKRKPSRLSRAENRWETPSLPCETWFWRRCGICALLVFGLWVVDDRWRSFVRFLYRAAVLCESLIVFKYNLKKTYF